MRKIVSMLLVLAMMLTVSVCFAEEEVSTGLGIITSISGSDATEEKDGLAQAEIAFAAVTVDANGVIVSCAIDTIQSKIYFNAKGELTTAIDATFPSKMVLGDAYGMRKASSISAEWNEQAAVFATWCVGKTIDEIKNIPVDENGKATDADVIASVTLKVGPFVSLVEKAVANAQPRGAKKGDKLYLASYTVCNSSKSATAEKAGNAQGYAAIGVVTVNEGVITSCCFDAVQANCAFDATGKITADLTAEVPTKIEKGDAYGMRVASGIGKEWFEQAEGYCQFITGKTVADAIAIPVNDAFKTTDADLATSCTMSLDAFVEILAQCAE